MKIYYRISDNSYKKEKIPGTSKELCLRNFIKCFSNSEITIIADNCCQDTINMVKSVVDCPILVTNLSNASSFDYCLDLALQNDLDCINYFVEDDYIHQNNSALAIEEGLLKSDYVTLFDHPDKYESEYNYGETCKAFKTKSFIWRTTISTCMTFASKTSTLKKDASTFKRNLFNKTHPDDHIIFKNLKEKNRTLSLPIGGLAYHVDLTYQMQKIKSLNESISLEESLGKFIDSWVLNSIQAELLDLINIKTNKIITGVNNPDYSTLIILDVYLKSE